MTLPVGTNILIKPDESESTTKSGLIIPPVARSVSQKGIVVAISQDFETPLQVGDYVQFETGAAKSQKDGTIAIAEEYIWGVITTNHED